MLSFATDASAMLLKNKLSDKIKLSCAGHRSIILADERV